MIKAAGNTELCELLDVELKAVQSMSVVLGRPASFTARAGTSFEMERKRTRSTSSSLLTSFRFPIITSRKGDSTDTVYGKKEGDHEYFIANQLKEKYKKRVFLSIHDRFIRDARFRKTMIELGRTEEVIREMDKLANEDHTHHATAEETSVYRNNWWIRSNFCWFRHDARKASSLISKKHCLPCVASRIKRNRLITKIGGKALLHLCGTGKIPGGILQLSITATMDQH